MADFSSMVGSIEKLNEYNYRDWRSCIKFYLKGQDLWEVVDGSETSPPEKDEKKYNSWIVKASKAMYVLMSTIDKSLRSRIEDAETPKEAWDILASLFSRKNPARLQLLERELMNTTQGTLSINEYFLKVKNLCREIEQLDAEAKFGDARVRRIIINGLKPEYNNFIVALQGWEKQPSLIELENLLANQEALEQQISKVTIKPQETEEAMFSAKSASQRFKKKDHTREDNRKRCKHCGHKSSSEDEEDEDKGEHRQHEHRQPGRGECFVCGRKGHYARDCKLLKKIQSNFAKMDHKSDESEEEWDFEATYAVEEEVSEEEEEVWDFEAPYANEEDASEDEWDHIEYNIDDIWIEELESGKIFEMAPISFVIMKLGDNEDNEDVSMKVEEEHDKKAFPSLDKGEMMVTQSDTQEQVTGEEKLVRHEVKKLGELKGTTKNVRQKSNKELQVKIENTSNTRKAKEQSQKKILMESKMETQEQLIQKGSNGQDRHAKFDIGSSIKRPPDGDDELGIEGEY